MAYLISADYNRSIQDSSLQQTISGNLSLKFQAELAGIAEMKSYLSQKYDVVVEFTDTVQYSHTVIYKAGNRVYLAGPFYNPKTTYGLNALVSHAGYVYVCTIAITVAEEFNGSKWLLLGAVDDIYFVTVPAPGFEIKNKYAKDDIVFWKNKKYKCLQPTDEIAHETAIQFPTTNSIPELNIFPDDPKNGGKAWQDLGTYTVAAGSITDTTKWTKGDNRNQQMVMYLLDISIYHMYGRIPPGVVPDIRIMRYQTAISWLKNAAKGEDIVADIEKLQPAQGGRIRFGSRTKQDNFY